MKKKCLDRDVKATEAYCNKVLEHAKQRIAEGEKPFKEKMVNLKRGYVITEAHSISCSNGDYLCYDIMVKTRK